MTDDTGVTADAGAQEGLFELDDDPTAAPAILERPLAGAEAAAQETAAMTEQATAEAADAIAGSLITLGYVAFDSSGADNSSSNVMVAEEHRAVFRRDAYVGISDEEQNIEFLGRVVEGPFHAPHEITADSAVGRTTVLHPERTRFRPSYYATGTIEVLGEIRGHGHILPTPTRPRPYSRTYLFPPRRLEQMLGLAGNLDIGHLLGYPQVRVHAPSDSKNFLPRNVGIFGTVGSGKSNTVQVLMEEAVAAGWAAVVVDVEGEYVRMNEATKDADMARLLDSEFGRKPKGLANFRVYVPSSGTSDADTPARFKVPLAEVQSHVLGDLLELSEPQMRMLYPLLDKLSRDAPAHGQAQARAARRMPGISGGKTDVEDKEGPAFTLQHVIDALDETKDYPGGIKPKGTPEAGTAHTLRQKMISLGTSGVLDWGGTRKYDYLPIGELLAPGRLSVLDVSETDDRSRNICISYVLQALFEQVVGTSRGEPVTGTSYKRPPVLVVLEEVHTFVSKASASRMRAVLDQLQIISRRGRKRWMGLALVSQQPGHVPDELFELANTRFIHQLKSTSNLAPVKQTTGGVHDALWSTVPNLGPGQCLLTGAVFRNPVFATIRPAASRRMLIN
jgi:DNA helicase HerA-like ATPase